MHFCIVHLHTLVKTVCSVFTYMLLTCSTINTVGCLVVLLGLISLFRGVGGGAVFIIPLYFVFLGGLLATVTIGKSEFLLSQFGFLRSYLGTGLFMIFMALLGVGRGDTFLEVIFWITLVVGISEIVIHFMSGGSDSPLRENFIGV